MSTYIQPFFVVESWLFPLKVLKGAQPFSPFHKNPTTNSTGFDTFQKGTSSTAANGCFPIMWDSQQRSARFWCGEWVGKSFWETNIQIFCLTNRSIVCWIYFFFLDGYMAGKEVLWWMCFCWGRIALDMTLGKGEPTMMELLPLTFCLEQCMWYCWWLKSCATWDAKPYIQYK